MNEYERYQLDLYHAKLTYMAIMQGYKPLLWSKELQNDIQALSLLNIYPLDIEAHIIASQSYFGAELSTPDGNERMAYIITILGDEMAHNYQFEKGNIGYSSEVIKGVEGSVVMGYDWEDEIESKESAIQSAKDNGLPVKGGSAQDYNKNVKIKKKENPKEWIDNWVSKKTGESYPIIFDILGKEGKNNRLMGSQRGDGKQAREAFILGVITHYIYRKKDEKTGEMKTYSDFDNWDTPSNQPNERPQQQQQQQQQSGQ